MRTQTYECPKCITQWVIELAFSPHTTTKDKSCPRCNTNGKLIREQEVKYE